MRTTMLTPDEYNDLVASQMSEADFQVQVVTLARSMGWKHYHTYDSRRSDAGWPDLALAHPTHGALFRELKTQTGRLTRAQQWWLDLLELEGLDAGVWRPADLFNGVIPAALRGAGGSAMTPHGTANRYINHGCKCAPCTAANTRRAKAYKLRRLEGVHSPTDRVPSIGARRRLQALATLGWSIPTIAVVAAAPVGTLSGVGKRNTITRATHDVVARVYDVLWDQVPPSTCRAERMSSGRVRALAVRRGWVPPLAWDDDSIDDPAAVPSGVRRRGERWSVKDVEELLRTGAAHVEVCRRLGTTPAALERRLHRAGRRDLLPAAWAGRRVA